MCTRPITVKVPSSARRQVDVGAGFQYVTVSCGKCNECLRKKRNEFGVLASLEAKRSGTLMHLTLTYNEKSLPIAQSIWRIDRRSGEYSRVLSPEILDTVKFPEVHGLIESLYKRGQRAPRIVEVPLDFIPSSRYKYVGRFTPTLNYDDVRLFFKSARQYYFREYGYLPKFKYSAIGEYGERSRRPHYHILLFGTSSFEANFLAWYWCHHLHYGNYTLRDKIPITDFPRVARYVSKYTCKGPSDNPAHLEGLCLKCRRCSSKGLGAFLTQEELSYFRCEDVFGKFNPHSSGSPELFAMMKERLMYRFSGEKFSYALPERLKNIVFANKYSKVSNSYEKSEISFAYSDFVRNSISDKAENDFKRFCQSYPSLSLVEVCAKYNLLQASIFESREQSAKEAYARFLHKSNH